MAGDRRSILFVEDDEPLRAIVARRLRRAGYGVAECGSAEEATEALDGGLRPGLVLLDLNLPGETGWGFLRDGALASAGSPAVLVASALTVNPRQLADFGVAGFLPKPFALDTLIDTVERLLRPADPGDA